MLQSLLRTVRPPAQGFTASCGLGEGCALRRRMRNVQRFVPEATDCGPTGPVLAPVVLGRPRLARAPRARLRRMRRCRGCCASSAAPRPGCTGPHADLLVDDDLLRSSLFIKTIETPPDARYVEEQAAWAERAAARCSPSRHECTTSAARLSLSPPAGSCPRAAGVGTPYTQGPGCSPYVPSQR